MSLNSTQFIKRISPCLILSAVVLLVTRASVGAVRSRLLMKLAA